jgi:hypothetical protein
VVLGENNVISGTVRSEKDFFFFLLPENSKITDEIRKAFQRNRPNTFYLLGPGSERKKELKIRKSVERKKSFERFPFFLLPGGKHRVACQKAKQTIGKTTFCGIGGTASRNLIKPVQY